ncbi:hypothetical protein CLU97_3494 [Chryseobacterium sp. 7]|uniref:hypothetical protein n=1 Tax=Chryseobacterium sp. 7 TaxID=2035214 RepID=UPI000EAFFF4D|nr:hypothetical protein [Chryseobacterium sp. 7]RLJ34004.1 hypothetical protein CLU97_3494 [Chryseobacterium sp. 7]
MKTKIYLFLVVIYPFLFWGQKQNEIQPAAKEKLPKVYIAPKTEFVIYDLKKGKYKKDTVKKKSSMYIDSTQHIIYDFQIGDYSKDIHKIRAHTPVVFKIKNVNPFVYKITITPKDSIVGESKFDKEFMNFFTEKELQKGEDKLSQEQTDASNNAPKQAEVIVNNDLKGNSTEKKENGKAISAIGQNQILNQENQKSKNAMVMALSQLDSFGIDILRKNKISVAERILEVKKSNDTVSVERLGKLVSVYNENKSKIEDNNSKIKSNEGLINEKTKEYQILLEDFNKKYKNFIGDCRYIFGLLRITKKVNTISEIPDLDSLKYIRDYQAQIQASSKELLSGITQIDEYKKSFSELSDAYVKLVTMNNLDLIMEKSGIDKILSYPKFQKEKADQLNMWFVKYHSDEVIRQAFSITTQLENLENYTVKSEPFQPENDMVEFKINIELRDKTKPPKNDKSRKFTYRQPIYGGTRVDFSLGLAAAYYGNVSRYEIGLDNKLTTFEKKFVSSSLVGMVTMSYRRTGYIAYGGSAGMGLDVVGGKIQISNFFIGPTMLIGKKDRIFFTLGASLKNVRELKDGYLGLQVPAADDLTSYSRDKYRVGIFASLTYSLTRDARALIKNLR